MIRVLKGKILKRNECEVILDVSGFGIYIKVLENEQINNIGEEEILYTKMIISENKINFYGFKIEQRYEMFDKLLSIKGIGPSICINILNSIKKLNEIDKKTIVKVKGVGNKLADTILKELGTGEKSTINIDEFVKLGFKKSDVQNVVDSIDDRISGDTLNRIILEKLCEVNNIDSM